MKTIRVQLHGGLGNQLFIWAMAHEICSTTGKCVQLEFFSDSKQRKDRPNEIQRLVEKCEHNISINQTSYLGNLFRILDKIGLHSKSLKNLISRVFRIYDCKTSYEVPNFNKIAPRFIRGYFQSAIMVQRNRETLQKEIESQLSTNEVFEIKHLELVLHIRRGDTLEISKSWGVLSLNYYLKLVDKTKPMTICLDDATQTNEMKKHFPNALILTPENFSTWQTLTLMSRAETLIVANSTLSWWGAWLKSQNNPEVVYFPNTWRPDDSKSFDNLLIESVHLVKSEFQE